MKVSRVPRPAKKPKLGQHFLDDTAAAVRIVEALGDLLQSTVLEIGPGRGALTNLLARRARRVIAVEKEDRKSTRLNSSHLVISYAVFCLKKKNTHVRVIR